jgi:hypothetical protein
MKAKQPETVFEIIRVDFNGLTSNSQVCYKERIRHERKRGEENSEASDVEACLRNKIPM